MSAQARFSAQQLKVGGFSAKQLKQVNFDARELKDALNAVVTYHNPLDNVSDLAHHFFTRCLAAEVTPYVVTKKTVFKWQEGFWQAMKAVFDEHYKDKCALSATHPAPRAAAAAGLSDYGQRKHARAERDRG